ncbi:MAG: hypothetical protein FJX46_02925 [Alphaproteobacteria bacterium]|nr:hypothetical protein [Alphaproteobacteria bacterium]
MRRGWPRPCGRSARSRAAEPPNVAALGVSADRAAGLVLAALAAGIAAIALAELPMGSWARPGAGAAPLGLGLILGGFGLALAWQGGGAWEATDRAEAGRALAILAAAGFAALAFEALGYRLTMAAMLAFLLLAVERKPVLPALAWSALLSLGSFHAFSVWLRVPLPRGPFGF